MRKYNIRFVTIVLCIITLFLFFLSTVINFGKSASYKLGITKEKKYSETYVKIDWQKKYPFSEKDLIYGKKSGNGVFDFEDSLIRKIIDKTKSIVSHKTSDEIIGYINLVSLKRKIDDLISWNISPLTEYNSVTKLEDGYLVGYMCDRDTTLHIESVVNFEKFCRSNDIKFIYVHQPDKISKYTDTKINGILDYSNTNSDSFLKGISENGVDNYDLREEIVKDDLSHRDLFFKTDHHWKPETGLWATEKIVKELNNRYGYDFDYNLLKSENFDKEIYEDWFLGSQGKKMTLSVSKLEDISLLYPKFDTNLTYKIPSINMEKTGNFAISYDYKAIEEKDYYNSNPYGAYAYADRPLIQIANHLADNDVKILVIRDSFANVIVPFLSLVTKEVSILDLRHFNGSLKSYVMEYKPNIVIMTHRGQAIRDIDYAAHDSTFDLR